METKVISSGVRYSNLPESYIRPESERPRLSEVSDCENVPVIDLGSQDKAQIVKQVGEACKFYGFFQVLPTLLILNQTHVLFLYKHFFLNLYITK